MFISINENLEVYFFFKISFSDCSTVSTVKTSVLRGKHRFLRHIGCDVSFISLPSIRNRRDASICFIEPYISSRTIKYVVLPKNHQSSPFHQRICINKAILHCTEIIFTHIILKESSTISCNCLNKTLFTFLSVTLSIL